jgi:hypothetical protein
MRLRFATDEEQGALAASPDEYRAAPERDEAILYKGTGAAPKDVPLRSTPAISPDVELPALMQPAYSPGGGAPGDPGSPGGAPGGGAPNFGDRASFENFVFRQIGGNPFAVDVQREVDRATASDLPKLFERVFRGQAIWADRDKLSPKQQELWQDEVRRYRAFVKDRVSSDRNRKLEMYKLLVGQYEADRKEREAQERKQSERERAFRGWTRDQAQAEKSVRDRMTRLDGEERHILADMARVMQDAGAAGALNEAQAAHTQALAAQLQRVRGERHALRLRYEPGYREEEMKKVVPNELAAAHRSAAGAPGAEAPLGEAPQAPEETVPARPKPWERVGQGAARPPAAGPAAPPTVVRKKLPDAGQAPAAQPAAETGAPAWKREANVNGYRVMVGPKGVPVEVRRHKSGRMLAKYADGTIEVIEEAQ